MLSKLKEQNLFRERLVTNKPDSTCIEIKHIRATNFASNDYLGLAHDQRIIDAFIAATKHHGLGSTSSPAICGYSTAHQELEAQCAQLVNKESAILFNSGYQANIACIRALNHRKNIILADRRIHASLIDGATLSRAHLYRLHSPDAIQAKLIQHPHKPAFIITESIYSMDGSTSILPTLKHSATVTHLVDHSHGIGILNAEHIQHANLISFGLGKAIASIGGIVASDKNTIETIHQLGQNYRYSTSLPPAQCAATSKAISLIQKERWRVEKLIENINFFTQQALRHNIKLENQHATPIKTIVIGSNKHVLQAQDALLKAGLFVAAIRPPTVAKHKTKLRISLSAAHNVEQIAKLIHALTHLAKESHHER